MNSRPPKRNVRAKSATQPSSLNLLKARIRLYDAKLQVLEDTRKAIVLRPRIDLDASLLDCSFVQRVASGSQTLKGRQEIKRRLEATALPLYEGDSDSDLVNTARKSRHSVDLTESLESFGMAKPTEDTRIKKTETRSPYDSLCLRNRAHFENTYLSPVRQSCGSVLRDDDKENDVTKARLEALEVEVQRIKKQNAVDRKNKEQAIREKEAEFTLLKDKYEGEKASLVMELSQRKKPTHSRSHSRSPLSTKASNDLELRLQELMHKNCQLTQELQVTRLGAKSQHDQVYSTLVEENARLKTQNTELEAQLKGRTQPVCTKCRAFLLANGELTFKLSKLKALVDC